MILIILKDYTGHYYNYPQSRVTQSSKSGSKDVQRLQKDNTQLNEENNLLKVKNELLLDMVAEICSEYKLDTMKKNKNKK
jgi:cell division protein FtsB